MVAALVLAMAGACGSGSSGQAEEDEKGSLQVVVTFSVLADIVENVTGDDVELTTIVGSEEDTHTFEATPSDNRALSEADLVFLNGLGFENWMDDLYESSGSEARRVTVTEGVDLLRIEDHREEGSHEHEEASEFDPHVWMNPDNVVIMVGTIRESLVEADSENAEVYRGNAESYIAELEELDAEISDGVADIPQENRKLVTGHQVFGYFAERYGFEVTGTAISSQTTEASDPSAGAFARLADEIEQEEVPAIFPERSTTDRRIMERLAREADVELAPPLFTDALSETGPGDTYISMMSYNARTIADALERR
ncbi:MAG: zinc ABC transporter substrate-binding protein [Rubrobacteraceae bacterium]